NHILHSQAGSASVVISEAATGRRLNLYSVAAKDSMQRGIQPSVAYQAFSPMLFSPDSQRLAFCCADKIVIAIDEKRLEILSGGGVRSLAFSGQGKFLAGLANNQIKVWDSGSGEQLHILLVGGDADRAALTPDGSRAATL